MNTIIILSLLNLFGTDIGTTALPILKNAVGPRPAALGEAFTALSDDATGCWWNPAGLGLSRNYHTFLSHQEWFHGIRDEYASLALPAGKGRLGLGLVYSGVSGIEQWDETNQRASETDIWNHTAVLNVAYGSRVAHRLYLGGNVKLAYDYLGDFASGGYGGGLGLGVIGVPWDNVRVAAACQNLGVADYTDENGYYLLPAELRCGVAYTWRDLTVTADGAVPVDNKPHAHIGAEYTLMNTLTFRAGYRTGPQDLDLLGYLSGLCCGLGVRIGAINVDYAFVPYGELGIVHRIGLRTASVPRPRGSIKFYTIDVSTGDRIPAEIEVAGIRNTQLVTERDGVASLTGLKEGWVKLRVTSRGYDPVEDSVYAYGNREQGMTLALGKPGRGTIWGKVLDAKSKKPVIGIVAYSGRSSGEVPTDRQEGNYVIHDLPNGSYVLTARDAAERYETQTCTLSVELNRVTTFDFTLEHKPWWQ